MLTSQSIESNILLQFSLIFENLKEIKLLKDDFFFSFSKHCHFYFFIQRNETRYFFLLEKTDQKKKNTLPFLNGIMFSVTSKILIWANFKIEKLKVAVLKIFRNFAEILERFLEIKRRQVTSINEYFFKSKKNRKNFHELIYIQVISHKGSYFNSCRLLYQNEKITGFFRKKISCDLFEISKNFYTKRKKTPFERKLVLNALNSFQKIDNSWRPSCFYLNNKIFELKRGPVTLHENFFETVVLSTLLISFSFLKKPRLICLESFGKIFKLGLSILSRFSTMNEYGLKRFFEKRTHLTQFVKTFLFDVKKASLMLSFETNSDMLRAFLKNHLFSICPVEKEQSVFLSVLLPCCHLISYTTNKDLINYFSIEQKTKDPYLNCPCCQVSFPCLSDKKMIFD